MKNLKIKSVIIILISILGLGFASAKNPAYEIKIENQNRTAPNIFEFDIYLLHTNSSDSKFEYFLGQYFFDFNPDIANGGELTYSIVKSDLPHEFQPGNPTVAGKQLRLATNGISGAENLPSISDKAPGTLVARMRLVTSAKTFSEAPVNLRLRTGPQNPFTKIGAYVDNQAVDITNHEFSSEDNISGVEENNSLPKEFSLQQNYPNPFNPTTNISVAIPRIANVSIAVYDITGREIAVLANEKLEPGIHSYKFNGNNFASGVYFYRISAVDLSSGQIFLQTRKMLLVK